MKDKCDKYKHTIDSIVKFLEALSTQTELSLEIRESLKKTAVKIEEECEELAGK